MYHVRIVNHDGYQRLVGLIADITEELARAQTVDLYERGNNQSATLWRDMSPIDTYTNKGWASGKGRHRKMAAE